MDEAGAPPERQPAAQGPPRHDGARNPRSGSKIYRLAGVYLAVAFCLPFLSLCLAIDLLLYFVFRHVLDSCYALLCLLD